MAKFENIGAAAAHAPEPGVHHQAKRLGPAEEPGLDLWITPNGAVEPKQIVHPAMMPARPPGVEPATPMEETP